MQATLANTATAWDVQSWAQFGDAAHAALECRPPRHRSVATELGSAANPFLLEATVSLMLAHTATLTINTAR